MSQNIPGTVPTDILANALRKLETRKKQITTAYNVIALLCTIIFIGALLDYAQGMFAGIAALVAVAALAGLGITLFKLVNISKEN